MWEYLVLLACGIVLAYFIYKFFEKKKDDIDAVGYHKPVQFPESSAPQRKVFSKPMKPFYFGEGKKDEAKPLNLEKIASCSVCRDDLNTLSKMVCLKCLRIFCSKHLRKHKCKTKKFPPYEMAHKKYEDGTTVYYTDRKVPIQKSD